MEAPRLTQAEAAVLDAAVRQGNLFRPVRHEDIRVALEAQGKQGRALTYIDRLCGQLVTKGYLAKCSPRSRWADHWAITKQGWRVGRTRAGLTHLSVLEESNE